MKAGSELHIYRRKRVYQKLKKFPHPNKKIRFLDGLVMLISFIFPFTALPQVWSVWIVKDAAGVSLITWALFFTFSIPLLIYAITHRVKPLIIMYSLWLLVHGSMVIGTLLYG